MVPDPNPNILFEPSAYLKPDPCNDDIPRLSRDQGNTPAAKRALYRTSASY